MAVLIRPDDRPLPAGVRGCRMLIDPVLIPGEFARVRYFSSRVVEKIALPASLPPVSVFRQFAQLDGAGVVVSNGLRTDIR